MNTKRTIREIFSISACLFIIVHISGCSEKAEFSHSAAEAGSAVFRLIWPGKHPAPGHFRAAGSPTIDCIIEGISTIVVEVYEVYADQEDKFLTSASFQCTDGEGIVNGIPPGTGRRFIASGKDANGAVIYEGQTDELFELKAGQTTKIGPINMALKDPKFLWYYDADKDGYGDRSNTKNAIEQPFGYVAASKGADCDDNDSMIYPGADEIIDNYADENCDGIIVGVNFFINSLGMTFNLIPEGVFLMGSPEEEVGRFDDENQHYVALTKSFFMQTTEVTQEQWETVMRDNPAHFINCGSDCPVEQVSWEDVQDFIIEMNKRNEGTYRLPTEAEWEYAARGKEETAFANGGVTVTDCSYDGNLNEIGWYCWNAEATYNDCKKLYDEDKCLGPYPVGSKSANGYGLHDMHGNVWEWCQDYYELYPSSSITSPDIDPIGFSTGEPPPGSRRVLRGGSWGSGARYCRAANRNKSVPQSSSDYWGFRLVLVRDQ